MALCNLLWVPRTSGDETESISDVVRIAFGVSDEWHLVISNPHEHTVFDLPTRARQSAVSFDSALCHAGLEAVGPFGDSMDGDRSEDLAIHRHLDGRHPGRPRGRSMAGTPPAPEASP